MAIGDAAAAAGFTPVAGTALANTIETEINRLADFTVTRIIVQATDPGSVPDGTVWVSWV